MPLTGAYAWKGDDLSLDERVDHFFNLIDHAVENGVPLAELYSREHVKTFLCYVVHRAEETCKAAPFCHPKDRPMPKLNLTSTFASSVIVGEPGILVVNLPPKETRSVEVTESQLRQLTPQLEKLAASNWISYTVSTAATPAAVKVEAAPEPVTVVEKVKMEVKPEPEAPPPPAPEPTPEPVVEEPVAEAPPPAPKPSAPKPQSYDKKNRR